MGVTTLERVSTAAIIANGCVFAWGMADHVHAEIADAAEHIITGFFLFELGWRWRAARWRLDYLRGWSAFDAVVIVLAMLPALPGVAVLRIARLARAAKLLHLARHASQLRILALVRH
jgi:hypothetical protein